MWRIHERCLSRLATNRQHYLGVLGDEAVNLIPREAALRLTQHDLAALTGREMQRRNLYRYLAIFCPMCAAKTKRGRCFSPSCKMILLTRSAAISTQTTSPESSAHKNAMA